MIWMQYPDLVYLNGYIIIICALFFLLTVEPSHCARKELLLGKETHGQLTLSCIEILCIVNFICHYFRVLVAPGRIGL